MIENNLILMHILFHKFDYTQHSNLKKLKTNDKYLIVVSAMVIN